MPCSKSRYDFRLTRRSAIIIGLAVLIAAVMLRGRHVLRQLIFKPGGESRPPQPFDDPFVEEGKALVVLVTGAGPDELVRQSLELLGAARRLDLKGKRVLVKPNVVTGSPAPTTTSPEIVRAVCLWLKEQGASVVWVGDMSALMSLGTPFSMWRSGIKRAAEEAGAIPVCFEEHEWLPVELPGANILREVHVSKFILEADAVINIPVMKTHKWASYSACLKNFIGATHARYRPYNIDSSRWEEIIAELNLAYRPVLNLVDATKVMYAGGPWRGDSADVGMVIAGGDRVACDALAVAFMKTYNAFPKLDARGVWEQTQIKRAAALGVGIDGPSKIKLLARHIVPPAPEMRARLDEAIQLALRSVSRES